MRHAAVLSAIIASALLAACALTRGPDRPVLLHLAATPDPMPAGAVRTGAVSLEPVAAEGAAAQVRYAYVLPDGSLRQAATLFWELPPPRAVERALIAALSRRYAAVRRPGDTGRIDHRLAVTVTRFHERAGPNARAVVGLDARVVDAGAADRSIRSCAASRIAGAAPGDRAAAFETALADAASRLVARLADRAARVADDC